MRLKVLNIGNEQADSRLRQDKAMRPEIKARNGFSNHAQGNDLLVIESIITGKIIFSASA